MQRILVVHSTHDTGVDKRIELMARNPQLSGLDFHHVYFILPSDEEAMKTMKPQELLKRNEHAIRLRLQRQIEMTAPDLVVLHTGVVFSFSPEVILRIFGRLKSDNPQLLFAIQKGTIYDQVSPTLGPYFSSSIDLTFDKTPEVQAIVDRMF
jgi:hypothetical protein